MGDIFRRVERDEGILIQHPDNEVLFKKMSYAELSELIFQKTSLKKKYKLSDRGYEGKAISLLCRSVLTGKWSTGHKTDSEKSVIKLINLLQVISAAGGSISLKSKIKIKRIIKDAPMDPNSRASLYNLITQLEDREKNEIS